MFKIFILSIFCLTVKAFNPQRDHPYYIPSFLGGAVKVGGGSGHREIEYESNKVIVDQQVYKYNDLNLEAMISPWEHFVIGFSGAYDPDREYEIKFGPGSSRSEDEQYSSSSSGFLDPEVFLIYQIKSGKDSWNQQIKLQGNPFDIKEKPRKIYRGGHDIFLDYRFSHQYDNGALFGTLFSHYFGKKNFYQPGDPRLSISDPYTEVGIDLGYLLRFNKRWSLKVQGTFGLISDYVVRTPEVTRSADKGYMLQGLLGLNFRVNPNNILSVEGHRGSRIFNATNEEINRDIEYEIENDFLLFKWSYFWEGMK